MRRLPYLFSVLMFSSVLAPTFGQKPATGEPKDAVEVTINLLATDPKGAPTTDLELQQLRIFEDGVQQQPMSLERIDKPLSYGMVIDHSGSVRTQLPQIKSFAKQLIAGLDQHAEGFLVGFTSPDKTALLQDWTSNRGDLVRAVDSLTVDSGPSAVLNAIGLAANHLFEHSGSNNTRRNVLILISDCEERTPLKNLPDFFAKLRGSGIQVFVVAPTGELPEHGSFMNSSVRSQAELLANRIAFNSGGVAYPSTGPDLSEITPRLLAELRSQYLVRYRSTNTKRSNDRHRKIRVEIVPSATEAPRNATVRENVIVPSN